MTELEEIKKANHPDRIWATVNGMSTRLPDGARQLVGGWSQDADRTGAVEYVLASTLESLQRENEALKKDRDFWKEQFQVETRYRIELADRGTLLALTDANSRAEAAEAEAKRLRERLEPFRTVSKDWVDENGWTDVACQKDRIVDWFGPSDFRALASTGGEHNAE